MNLPYNFPEHAINNFDKLMMALAIKLASKGSLSTRPNPNVGCVIVRDNKVIGTGHHLKIGGPHAEIEALNSVIRNRDNPHDSVMYVTLEPCSHFGLTPPCVKSIIEARVKKVIIGSLDPNPLVNGSGVSALKDAKIAVEYGVFNDLISLQLRRFKVNKQNKRPFIILKWAQTKDGYLTSDNQVRLQITGSSSLKKLHLWRAREAAILVGTNTALIDNPKLNVRLLNHNYPQPLRIIFDRNGRIPLTHNIFNQSQPTLVLTSNKNLLKLHSSYHYFSFYNPLIELIELLKELQVESLIIEGGQKVLESFINAGLWDEIRLFTSPIQIKKGLKAPQIPSFSQCLDLYDLENDLHGNFDQVKIYSKEFKIDLKQINEFDIKLEQLLQLEPTSVEG